MCLLMIRVNSTVKNEWPVETDMQLPIPGVLALVTLSTYPHHDLIVSSEESEAQENGIAWGGEISILFYEVGILSSPGIIWGSAVLLLTNNGYASIRVGFLMGDPILKNFRRFLCLCGVSKDQNILLHLSSNSCSCCLSQEHPRRFPDGFAKTIYYCPFNFVCVYMHVHNNMTFQQ